MLSRQSLLALIGLCFALGCGQAPIDPAALEPAKITRPSDLTPASYSPDTVETPRSLQAPAKKPTVASDSLDGPIRVFFSDVWGTPATNKVSPKSIADACARFIDTAKSTLDVCGFEIDNQTIIDAIVRVHRRGVRVRVVTETDYLDEIGPRTFAREQIPVISDQRSPLMHNKFLIIDNKAVWTGSVNFTENCCFKNNNNGNIFYSPRLAANYTEKFHWFWDYRKFGGRPHVGAKIPYPQVKLDDGTLVENYFSTHDGCDKRLIARIAEAKQSIKFLAFSFTHDQIAKAVIERAEAGVIVRGVFETRQISKSSEMDRLSRVPNCDVRPDGNRYNMHHKVFIIDDQIVVAGSYNFSASATHDNDENMVIVHNAAVARLYDEEFSRVYQAAMTVAGRTSWSTR